VVYLKLGLYFLSYPVLPKLVADPLLTPIGKDQAHAIHREWSNETSSGLPPPHRRYCSPLTRALDTCDIIFGTDGIHPQPVLVVEVLRIDLFGGGRVLTIL